MTAPVTTAPSAVRAAAPSGADGDPASGATFASALDGALHPDRAPAPGVAKGRPDTPRGRSAADHGVPAHARAAGRPPSPARDHDGTPGLKARSRRDERTPADDAPSDPKDAAAGAGGPGTPPVPADALVAAALAPAVLPAWAPSPAPVPTEAAVVDTDPAPVGTVGAPAPAVPDAAAGQPQPAAADLSAVVGAPPAQASPQPVHPAALQLLATAGTAAPTPAAATTAGVPAGPATQVAVATSTVVPAPSPAPAAATPDGGAPLPTQVSLSATAAVAPHAVGMSTRATDPTAPAGADPAAATVVPALDTAVPAAVGATGPGGSSSADSGDADRQDPSSAAAPAVTTVVGTPPAAPAAPVLAPVATAAAAPVAPPPVATQLVQHVAVLNNGPDGTHSVTVVLHPDSLGPVQVQVTLSQGTIDLTMRGAHEHGRAALLDALPDLRRDLESAGLTCSTLDVDQGTGGSWSTQHQSAQQQAAQHWGEGRGQNPGRGENRPQPWLRPVVPAGGPVAGLNRSTSAGVDVRV